MTVAQKREIERELNLLRMDMRLGRKKEIKKMITKRQKEELQEQFNHYSYLFALKKSVGNYLEYERYLAKMGALKDAFYALGYTIKCERQDEKCGIKYYYYEFVKA